MNVHRLKKSAEHWAQRLFNQASAASAMRQPKSYFAHRHHDDHTARAESPFGALFKSDADLHKPELVPDSISLPIANAELALVSHAGVNTVEFTVLNSYTETADTKTFRLGRQDAPLFDYLPGQYVTLAVVISGQTYQRSYSLASTATHSGILEITVKRAPNGGLVSNWLNDHLSVGDTVNLTGPFGKFSCAKHKCKKILLLAAGSGIVPIMAMLRWLTDTEAVVDVLLLLSFRTVDDIIYKDELNLIAARHKNINLMITLTTDAVLGNPLFGLMGRVDKQMLHACVPDLPERTVYLCGPAGFMADCKKNLLQLNLPAEQLFCESFMVNQTPVSSQADALRPPTGNYQISFAKSGKTIAADGGMTLLVLAEKHGIPIEHDCRSGHCGECMIKCLQGKIAMNDQAEIAELDKNSGWVYACCAYPTSNVELDI